MPDDFIVYVDFDSTLFNTRSFTPDLFSLIAEQAKVSTEEVADSAHRFVSHPGLGGYDYAAHLSLYRLDSDLMWHELDRLMQANDYLYADSAAFIQLARSQGYDPMILSFGDTKFQLAKIEPTLRPLQGDMAPPLKIIVVDRKKHEHIRSLHSGQRGVLIDDVPDQELPEGFTEIHMDRNAALPGPAEKAGGFVVSDFEQAFAVIEQLAGH